jgi:type IX secretion system PorP/SprF family membrane protein
MLKIAISIKRFMQLIKRTVLVWTFVLCASFGTFAQDVVFSQFYASPLSVNPAFAGIAYGPRLIANYRAQWPTLQNAFTTYAVSYDQHIRALSGGIGIHVIGDQLGDGLLQRYEARVSYAYQMSINRRAIIKMAVEGSFSQTSIDEGRVILPDMINIRDGSRLLPTSEPGLLSSSFTSYNFGAGVMAYSTEFFGGLSVRNAVPFAYSFLDDQKSKRPMRIHGYMGGTIMLSRYKREQFYMAPATMFGYESGFTHLTLGTIVNRQNIYGGIWFRHAISNMDAVTLSVGMSRDKLKVGYSHDFSASKIGTATGGAHEVSLVFNFAKAGNSVINRRLTVPIPSPVFL